MHCSWESRCLQVQASLPLFRSLENAPHKAPSSSSLWRAMCLCGRAAVLFLIQLSSKLGSAFSYTLQPAKQPSLPLHLSKIKIILPLDILKSKGIPKVLYTFKVT